jgi:hypothetical protein
MNAYTLLWYKVTAETRKDVSKTNPQPDVTLVVRCIPLPTPILFPTLREVKVKGYLKNNQVSKGKTRNKYEM